MTPQEGIKGWEGYGLEWEGKWWLEERWRKELISAKAQER